MRDAALVFERREEYDLEDYREWIVRAQDEGVEMQARHWAFARVVRRFVLDDRSNVSEIEPLRFGGRGDDAFGVGF